MQVLKQYLQEQQLCSHDSGLSTYTYNDTILHYIKYVVILYIDLKLVQAVIEGQVSHERMNQCRWCPTVSH